MTLAAGSKLRASELIAAIPQEVASTTATANSANITTTETTVISVTAALVSGRNYRVRFAGQVGTSQATVRTVGRIREDSSTGTQLQRGWIQANDSATEYPHVPMEAVYTAVATGNKTFVFTLVRASGTGNHFLVASTTDPAYLYVDQIVSGL